MGTHCQAKRVMALAIWKDAVVVEGKAGDMVMAEMDMVAQLVWAR